MQLDPLSCVMMLVVTGVGFLIHVYSIGYMAHEGGYYRFFGYLNLFMFSMLVLVLADNYLMMFVGWEGVGLCSYLLIGFYFLRKSASDAGKKAFIVNRIGDAAFLLGVMLMVVTFGTLDFHSITASRAQRPISRGQRGDYRHLHFALHRRHGEVRADSPLHLAARRHGRPHAGQRLDSCGHHGDGRRLHGGALECACSRFPPRRWRWWRGLARRRPSGRRPSAWCRTISSACWPIRRSASWVTCFWPAAWAHSAAGVFHLMTHAFFKALLFLGAGSVIHAMSGEQDMRKMGALWSPNSCHRVGRCWLRRWRSQRPPLLSGFFSKDEILWQSFAGPYGSTLLWFIGLDYRGPYGLLHVPADLHDFCGQVARSARS